MKSVLRLCSVLWISLVYELFIIIIWNKELSSLWNLQWDLELTRAPSHGLPCGWMNSVSRREGRKKWDACYHLHANEWRTLFNNFLVNVSRPTNSELIFLLSPFLKRFSSFHLFSFLLAFSHPLLLCFLNLQLSVTIT